MKIKRGSLAVSDSGDRGAYFFLGGKLGSSVLKCQ